MDNLQKLVFEDPNAKYYKSVFNPPNQVKSAFYYSLLD